MAKRTPAQVYASLIGAGASEEAALILTEIAGAESGFDDTAQGDVGLEDSTWGPSFGLFQIRTSKKATGTGGDRDISNLAGDDQAQAAAALDISGGGTDFKPWTTYNTGAYLRQAAAVTSSIDTPPKSGGTTGSIGSTATPVSAGGPQPFPTFGPSWLPWNWPSDAGNAVAGQTADLFDSVRTVVIEVAFAALGIALIGIGIKHAAEPGVRRVQAKAEDAGEKAATVAALA